MSTPAASQELRPDRTTFAISMVLLALFVVTFNDLGTKWMSAELSLWQLIFMRSIFGIYLIAIPLFCAGKLAQISTKRRGRVMTRSLIMSISYVTFFTALAVLPVATVVGTFFSSPIFMVILSALMLKEQIGIWRIVSVIIGFVGVILIIRPDKAEFELFMLLPMASGFFYALTQIYTRKYCKDEEPLALTFWISVIFMSIGLIGMLALAMLPHFEKPAFLTFPFVWTDFGSTLMLIGIASCSLIMHFSLAAAYQNAPASLLAPLEYLYIPIASVAAYFVFDEVPDTIALLGIAIIIVSGLIITWRERVMRRKQAQQS